MEALAGSVEGSGWRAEVVTRWVLGFASLSRSD